MTCKKALISAPTDELFNVYLPIKKVKITDEHRVITAEGIWNGKIIGFSIEMPLNAEEIFDRNTLDFRKDIQVESFVEEIKDNVTKRVSVVNSEYRCKFISNGESTKNLFNALRIDNFDAIKPCTMFIFKNLFGDMNKINSTCESSDNIAKINYDSDPMLFALKEGKPNDENIRFKLEAIYDSNKEVEEQEKERELELFINILPVQKLLCLQEKDTANRPNLAYIFNDQEGGMKNLFKSLRRGILRFFGRAGNSKFQVLSPEEIRQRQGNLSKEEVEQILETAKSGHPDYQFFAGSIYAAGATVEPDMNKAIEWWEKSAEGGNALAQRLLGVQYATGEHVIQNYEEAFKWYKKAAANGDLPAICNLGLMYELGQYVPRDLRKAVEYYRKAADKNMPFAQIMLGDMYFNGHGINFDRKKACELYKKALSCDDISSVNSDQVAEVYALLGRAYAEKFANCGNITKTEAVSYLKKAFDLGNYESIRCLALLEKELDEDEINWLYQTASKYPNEAACLFALGICYEFGKGTAQDFKLAFKCYQKSADKGDPWGMHYLAYAYFAGQGTKKNLKEGFKWELHAAEFVPQAQFNVGMSYLKGHGVNKNTEESVKWLKRASENFYSAADEVLEEIHKNHR